MRFELAFSIGAARSIAERVREPAYASCASDEPLRRADAAAYFDLAFNPASA